MEVVRQKKHTLEEIVVNPLTLNIHNHSLQIEVIESTEQTISFRFNQKAITVPFQSITPTAFTFLVGNLSYDCAFYIDPLATEKVIHLSLNGEVFRFSTSHIKSLSPISTPRDIGEILTSKMPGKVVKLLKKVGEKVAAGESVVVVEAMKMENEFRAKYNGIVHAIHVKEGETIGANTILATIKPIP